MPRFTGRVFKRRKNIGKLKIQSSVADFIKNVNNIYRPNFVNSSVDGGRSSENDEEYSNNMPSSSDNKLQYNDDDYNRLLSNCSDNHTNEIINI
ncbi:hypothetical protein C0J52_00566 [Blattella germanica]|nr:hypothetical protein C0J52_00566 [Blattella germanica]